MLIYTEGRTPAQQEEANRIGFELARYYPNQPWNVLVDFGGIAISNGNFDPTWKLVRKGPTFGYSASSLKREILSMAGEWLERCNLSRAMNKNTEDEVTHMEGVPDRYQPGYKKPALEVPIVYGGPRTESEMRPDVIQAVKEIYDK